VILSAADYYTIVGTGVTIHPGVTLGEGAAVGSASLVLEDLERWWVYLGVPARQYKKRDKRKLLEYGQEFLAGVTDKLTDLPG
jgi:galactoside O-acetyltransferase